MERFIREPGVKQLTKNILLDCIYHPADRKLENEFLAIAHSFSFDSKYQSMAFMYKGEVYSPKGYRPVRGQRIELLTRRLYDQMDKWLQHQEELRKERQVIGDFFSCLLTAANNAADTYALLPDCIKPAVNNINTHGTSPQLKPEQIQAFIEEHSQHIQTIKERIVLNMVT